MCGPNGTGKSGIVDALEFGLTGNVSRLSGKGRGGLSVKEHAPHVNSRTKPEHAVVTLDVTICSSGKRAKIVRTVKAPRSPAVSPDDREVRETLRKVEQHPEFTLSRREIIKYVLAEPGERAKEIQALLQLEKLETARSLLLKISNASGRERNSAESSRNTFGNSLMAALAIGELRQATLLAAVNEKRSFLGLASIEKLEAGTSIREGLEAGDAAAQVKVPKIQAKRDLAAARAAIGVLSSEDGLRSREEAVAALSELRKNEARLIEVSRDAMLKTALELFDERNCPVCATPWDAAEFRALVAAQRKLLADAAHDRQSVEARLAPLSAAFEALCDAFGPLGPYAANLPVPVDAAALGDLKKGIERRVDVLRKLLPIEQSVAALSRDIAEIASAVAFLDRLEAGVDALPEPSARDAARDYLTVGQERLHLWRDAATKHSAAKSRAEAAEKGHAVFGKTCDAELDAIYRQVEGEFRAFYRAINEDDEGAFEAQLTPSLGKLSFEVDFYGKGFFPPGAYHSEGHQDGMGLCLYLALMKHLLGARFTFAVLDDVLMSVDAGHRREVCSLLKAVFPSTQFIFTTHDGVWLNHMRHHKLVEGKNAITFRKWHVDHGPSEWKDTDVWAEIDELVSKNEIRAAAGQLRHYLEYVSAEWCSRLGGRVEYRADGKYELGDLLPAATSALGDAFKKAKAAAQSWKDQEAADLASSMHQKFSAAVQASGAEQWQINPAVHYNEWAAFQRRDFEPVVSAFKALEREFACDRCGEPLYAVRAGSHKEAVRCACSRTSLKLRDKPRERATA